MNIVRVALKRNIRIYTKQSLEGVRRSAQSAAKFSSLIKKVFASHAKERDVFAMHVVTSTEMLEQ